MIIRRLLQRLGDVVVSMRRLQMPMRVVALLPIAAVAQQCG